MTKIQIKSKIFVHLAGFLSFLITKGGEKKTIQRRPTARTAQKQPPTERPTTRTEKNGTINQRPTTRTAQKQPPTERPTTRTEKNGTINQRPTTRTA